MPRASVPQLIAMKEKAMRNWIGCALIAGLSVGCGGSAPVEEDPETLLRLDREWATTVKDLDKFMAYYAPDASLYLPGMPIATGTGAIRDALTKFSSTPGFSFEFVPAKADVSGDVGYTTGTYRATIGGAMEQGKYIEVWKKQSDGQWKVQEDIFNADSGAAPAAHVVVAPASITWGDPPSSLPPGSRMAIIAGDPSKAEPFVIRAQVPAGYKVAPHWHPGTENITVLSGTVALGMGETWDEAQMQALAIGGYASLPAGMRHFFLSRTAATFQVHGMGPFVINYVNAADDPSKQR